MYATYEFYTDDYYGDDIPQESFNKYADRASDYIDTLTFDRLVDKFPENERTQVKIRKAVCNIAEVIYNIDMLRKQSLSSTGSIQQEDGIVIGKTVTSVSSGSESISYSASAALSSVYTTAATDKSAEKALLRDTAMQYLSGLTDDNGRNLLYAGL